MSENPGEPVSTGSQKESGLPPMAPTPPEPGYQAPPAAGYEAPPAAGYEAPPAAGYEAPPAAGYEAPPAAGYEAPPAAGYEAPPAAGYEAPPAAGYEAPRGHHAAGQTFQSFDPKSLKGFDPKTVDALDWGIIAAGVIAFIFSLFSFYTYTVSISVAGLVNRSASASWSAWHGFFGWFGVLVALAGAVLLAIDVIARIELSFPVRLVVLAAFGLGLICLVLALFIIPGNTGTAGFFDIKVDKGHGIGYWVSLIAVLAGTVLSAKRFSDLGGKLPVRG